MTLTQSHHDVCIKLHALWYEDKHAHTIAIGTDIMTPIR